MERSYLYPKWIYGGPWDIWLNHGELIGKFIREERLTPVAPEHLPAHPYALAEAPEALAKAGFRPRPFPGGIRGPHLHYQGGVFLLSQEQWKKFSGAMLERYREKLGRVGTVSFDQLMDVAAGIEHL